MSERQIDETPGTIRVELNANPHAAMEQAIADSTGRILKLRKPSMLAEFNLIKAIGDASKNDVYRSMVTTLLYLESIDGSPVHTTTQAQVDGLIQRLERHGVDALMEGIAKYFAPAGENDDKDDIKK